MSPLTILIVAASADALEGPRSALLAEGHVVVTLSDPTRIAAAVREHLPDAVLLAKHRPHRGSGLLGYLGRTDREYCPVILHDAETTEDLGSLIARALAPLTDLDANITPAQDHTP